MFPAYIYVMLSHSKFVLKPTHRRQYEKDQSGTLKK